MLSTTNNTKSRGGRRFVSAVVLVLLLSSSSSLYCDAFYIDRSACSQNPLLFTMMHRRQSPTSCSYDYCPTRETTTLLFLSQEEHEEQTQQQQRDLLPTSFLTSPVLQQVYPALVAHVQQYGHPNIPLGTAEGRQCRTLRRLHIQQKLSEKEVQLLDEMGFTFHSLEDVYHTVDFDEMVQRLIRYEEEYQTGYQVPKKFSADPELGAWVTGIRRLGPTKIDPSHTQILNELGFAWKSNRKCGSSFMKQYRDIQQRLQQLESTRARQDVLGEDASIQKWISAQKELYRQGKLSETRSHYMTQLLDNDQWWV